MNFFAKSAVALAAAILAAAVISRRPPDSDPQLSFLIIRADQLRHTALGCYGDPLAITPNIDALAASGVRYDRCYSTPVCSAHRVTFDLGKHSHACPNSNKLHPQDRPLHKLFHDAGYYTARVGKWHETPDNLKLPPPNDEVVPASILGGVDYHAGHEVSHDLTNSSYYVNGSTVALPAAWRPTKYANLLNAQLDLVAASGQPFFMILDLEPPHTPYGDIVGTQWDVFDPGDVPAPGNVPQSAVAQAEQDLADYYSMTYALDAAAGRVLDHLELLGLADETVVVLTSDHGAHVGAHGLLDPGEQKSTPYEESMRVPLVIRVPGESPGAEAALFQTVDFKPLLLGLAGIECPPTAHGLKHVPGSVYVQYLQSEHTLDGPWHAAVRDDGVVFAVSEGHPSGWVMFDTAVDPLELSNLVGIGDPREAEMLSLLQESAALVGAPLP